MAKFSVGTVSDDKVIVCRVSGFLGDAEADHLVTALTHAISELREKQGVIRLLFDNREGEVFSARAMAAVNAIRSGHDPSKDRIAVMVANSLNKLQAKRSMSKGTDVFMSENAAMTWLTAWDHQKPVAYRPGAATA